MLIDARIEEVHPEREGLCVGRLERGDEGTRCGGWGKERSGIGGEKKKKKKKVRGVVVYPACAASLRARRRR